MELRVVWDEVLHEAVHHLNEAERLIAEITQRSGTRINTPQWELVGHVVAARREVVRAAQELERLEAQDGDS